MNMTLNDYREVCNSCTIYIISLAIAFLTIICISSVFFYCHCYLKRSDTNINTNTINNTNTETLIYYTHK